MLHWKYNGNIDLKLLSDFSSMVHPRKIILDLALKELLNGNLHFPLTWLRCCGTFNYPPAMAAFEIVIGVPYFY